MFMNNAKPWRRRTGGANFSSDGTARDADRSRHINLYAYVRADPINFTDPFGLQEEEDPPIVVTGSRCPSGWTCYDPGYGFQTIQSVADNGSQGPIVVTGGRSRRGRRALTAYEKRILICNGASQRQVNTFVLSSGLPFPFNLNSDVSGVTLSPVDGVSVAHLRNGIQEMWSSRGQFSLIAHEFAHHIQYGQGMNLLSYTTEWVNNGYQDIVYEQIARDFSRTVTGNYDSGKCR